MKNDHWMPVIALVNAKINKYFLHPTSDFFYKSCSIYILFIPNQKKLQNYLPRQETIFEAFLLRKRNSRRYTTRQFKKRKKFKIVLVMTKLDNDNNKGWWWQQWMINFFKKVFKKFSKKISKNFLVDDNSRSWWQKKFA